MRDELTNRVALFMLTLFVPYCITMAVSGIHAEPEKNRENRIVLTDEDGKKYDMEEFLPYMTAGEMNTEYGMEALKAQTVIARTNLLRVLAGKKEEKISRLPLVCLTPEDVRNGFGERKREEILGRLQKAARETEGEVLTYKGKYIEALYHQVSTGTTVSSEEIYGKKVPYLTAVDSSQDVESEEYMTVSDRSRQEVLEILREKGIGEKITEENIMEQLSIEDRTVSGFVKKVRAGDTSVEGEEWQKWFHLPSSNFYLEEAEEKIRMIVLGKGHCMGMSQYGAEQMAEQKKDHKEILKTYYPGTVLKRIP